MKGQLPWSVEVLRGQGIELFSRSEALVSGLDYELFEDVSQMLIPDQRERPNSGGVLDVEMD